MNIFEKIELINKQFEQEELTKSAMLNILNQQELEEDEIPQNSHLGASVKALLKNAKGAYSAIENLDLDYIVIGEYKCFKVDDELTGTEDIYFISPKEILYLESGCLIDF